MSGWRSGISESARRLLAEEVASCNPRFPAEAFVARFAKRRADHQQQCQSSTGQPPPPNKTKLVVLDIKVRLYWSIILPFFPLELETLNSTKPAQPVGGKRKRTDGEAEAAAKVAKKQRANTDDEKISPAESVPTKRRGRTRRSQGSKEQKDGGAEPADKGPPAPPEDGAVIVLLDENDDKKGLKKF